MKKRNNIKFVFFVIYIAVILSVYFWLVYPALIKPKGLTKTNIPEYAVSELYEVSELFSSYGKEWREYPLEPDLTNYVFGQKEPI